jgi:hypothetical protein
MQEVLSIIEIIALSKYNPTRFDDIYCTFSLFLMVLCVGVSRHIYNLPRCIVIFFHPAASHSSNCIALCMQYFFKTNFRQLPRMHQSLAQDDNKFLC